MGCAYLATRVRYRQSCGLDTSSVLLAYLFVSRICLAGLRFCFLLLFYFFPSPPLRSGEAFSSVIFPLFVFFYLFFGCSDGMEREACASVTIIIIVIIIIVTSSSTSLLNRVRIIIVIIVPSNYTTNYGGLI